MQSAQASREKPPIGPVLESYGWDGISTGHGGWRTTRCPFHEDRHPSARINEDEGCFRCFPCEISGDAWDIVQQVEGIGFEDAKRRVESITGHDGSSLSRRAGSQPASSKLPLWARDKPSRDRALSARAGGRKLC